MNKIKLAQSGLVPIGVAVFMSLNSLLSAMAGPAAHGPGEVLLVYNSNSPVSTAIAGYYALKRGVTNILAVSCQDSALNSGNEMIAGTDYTSKIQAPITNYLSGHTGINFIVLTKGIPIIIDGVATGAEDQGHGSPHDYKPSLDSYLAALGYSTANGNVKATIVGSGIQGVAWINKYYNSTTPFTHAAFGGYLVTRLDGYTQADATALVDRALAAEQNHGSGPVLLDVDSDIGLGDKTAMPPTAPSTHVTVEETYDHGNADLLHAAAVLQASGISNHTVITNEDVGARSNLLGFFSWGSNGNFDPSKYEALSFAPGAIANTYVSSSMYTFIGQYAGFTNVNLTGITNFNARIANANDDTHFYYFAIRLDSPSGQIIGTCPAPPTGDWQTWVTVSCPLISGLNGVHSVYLTFLPNGFGGDLYNLEWISFNKGNPTNVIAVSSYSTLSGDAYLETCSEGGQDLGSIPNGQSHLCDLIANGLTGAEGYVNEPTLDAIVGIAFTVKNYETGYTLAESFSAGTPYIGWEGTVVGDPLCSPYLNAGNHLITPTQASSYKGSAGGVSTEACSEGNLDVGQISDGSYTYYTNIDLTGATSFVARVANPNTAATIQIRLDSPTGTLIGTCTVPVTGDWQVWTTTSCNVANTTGTHDVYLAYTGGGGYLFNVQWFGFRLIAPPPFLGDNVQGTNLVFTWPTNPPGYTLISSTNLGPLAVWKTNLPLPVIVDGTNVVTNLMSGTGKFYRLMHP